jgi:hypothetical protein
MKNVCGQTEIGSTSIYIWTVALLHVYGSYEDPY